MFCYGDYQLQRFLSFMKESSNPHKPFSDDANNTLPLYMLY